MTNCAFTGESLKNVNWAGNFNMGAVNREFDRYNPFFVVQLLNWLLPLIMMKIIKKRYLKLNSLIPVTRVVKRIKCKMD